MNRAHVLFAAIVAAQIAATIGIAVAQDARGLFGEQATKVDGVTVRRVRDTSEHIVCYVATGWSPYTGGMQPSQPATAISCLREAGR